MRRLRMTATAVIVLAIVGSAFAFSAKISGNFCVSADGDIICDAVLEDVKIDPNGIQIEYYANWDGDDANCFGKPKCVTISGFSEN